jgi:hypothetical protein
MNEKVKRKKGILYYIYCALGEKSHPSCNKTADRVAIIRLLITAQILITNFFIIGGVIINVMSIRHHWDSKKNIEVYVNSSYQTPPKRRDNKNFEFE